MSEAIASKFMLDGKLYDTSLFDSLYTNTFPSVYEVIRITDGVPLFLEEHFERLSHSLESIGEKTCLSVDRLKGYIITLLKASKVTNNNVKLVINDFKSQPGGHLYLFLIPSSYPTETMYKEGVRTSLFNAVRENPNAKIINQSLRDSVNEYLKENSLFEAILVNKHGQITEGSRSNIFFIKNGSVYTCPANGVLLGVTRQRIIHLCRQNSIEVHEEDINRDSLSQFDAAFISGTSPKVLPIASIGEIKLDCNNECLRKIMVLYNQAVSNYIKRHSSI